MSYPGWPSLCLRATDLEASKRFYESAGLVLLSDVPGTRAVLGFGGFRLSLMTFLDENLINIRGADVPRAHAALSRDFPKLEGEPEHYAAGAHDADADGCCWTAQDPDGNVVFFDTNANETGPEFVDTRTADILDGALQELSALGARNEVLASLTRLREQLDR